MYTKSHMKQEWKRNTCQQLCSYSIASMKEGKNNMCVAYIEAGLHLYDELYKCFSHEELLEGCDQRVTARGATVSDLNCCEFDGEIDMNPP